LNITRITLALAVVAAAGLSTSDLRAQESTLPPAPNSGTAKGFSAENGPCFYNPYLWSSRSLLNNTYLGSELVTLTAEGGVGFGGCGGTYGLTPASFLGNWSYLVIDGQADALRSPYVSPEKVQAIKELSRVAAEAGPPRTQQPTPLDLTPPHEPETRTAHAPVPRIGEGYGSSALTSRTLVLRVAPGPKPTTYNGIPIVERGRSWERIETADGRRVWRQSVPVNNSYGSRAGVRSRYTSAERANARMLTNAAHKRLQRQEGIRTAPGSAASMPSSSSGASSASSSSSSSSSTKASALRGAGKKQPQ